MISGSDILFTTIHVITDWPISAHMNRDCTQRSFTAMDLGGHRGPIQRSVQHAPMERAHDKKQRAPFMNGNLLLHFPHPAVYIQGPDGKWLR
ncbi:unnamed protein product, partial [Staurois parvus]